MIKKNFPLGLWQGNLRITDEFPSPSAESRGANPFWISSEWDNEDGCPWTSLTNLKLHTSLKNLCFLLESVRKEENERQTTAAIS